ncbi:dicarboxylate/amino acid:cation symporter [Salibacterium sp. K-3]
MIKTLIRYLKKPWLIFISMILGVVIGVYLPRVSEAIEPVGTVYLSFLQMCIIPLIIFAIISSIGRLILSGKASLYVKRIIVVFIAGFLLTCGMGLGTAAIGMPGADTGEDTRSVLGEMLYQEEADSGEQVETREVDNLFSFVELLIPSNIFSALLEESTLQILLFSMIFGIAVGLIPSSSTEQFISITEVMFKAMEKMVAWTLYFLPFALISFMSSVVAQTGAEILQAMLSYVLYIHIAAVLIILISSIFISRYSSLSLRTVGSGLKKPLLVALGTRNSYATMPFIFESLEKALHVDRHSIHLVVPLSIIVCRFSMLLVFTLGSMFILQLYDMPLTGNTWLIIYFGAIVAALAGAGTPSVIATSMIALVLAPLGIPTEAAVILLLSVNPIIDPVLTVINVHLSSIATMIIAKTGRSKPDFESQAQEELYYSKIEASSGIEQKEEDGTKLLNQ